MATHYDFVVVGAGSAGCVVAARLTEQNFKVALLEAGGEADSFWIRTPLGYGKLYDHPKYNWLYEAEPEAELNGHSSYQPRGKVLGGTGSINGMVYMRGQAEDYDHWAQLGNVGWSYEDVLPLFKKSESYVGGESKYHGGDGPVRISDAPRHEIAKAFIEAAVQAGYRRTDDFNGARQEGFGYNQLTIRDGRRSSTAIEFLRPARKRANLNVITHALATRIVIERGRASGVEYQKDGESRILRADGEVIVCAGAINSPHLLQLSGIGPPAILQNAGVSVTHDLPGVGRNMQDHFTVPISFRCPKPITVNDIVNNPLKRLGAGLQYLLFRKGILAANAGFAGGCIRTDQRLSAPDVKLNLHLWNRASHGRDKKQMGLVPYSSFSISAVLWHPANRGTLTLRSSDPTVHPRLHFNMFTDQTDQIAAIEALRAARRIAGMPALSPYISAEDKPGAHIGSDEQLLAYCRENGRSSHHVAGTCKMGTDEMAVVDPKLRVHGIAGLRVADISIMPRIVAANTHAPAMMIGEKAAAMVANDAATRPVPRVAVAAI